MGERWRDKKVKQREKVTKQKTGIERDTSLTVFNVFSIPPVEKGNN